MARSLALRVRGGGGSLTGNEQRRRRRRTNSGRETRNEVRTAKGYDAPFGRISYPGVSAAAHGRHEQRKRNLQQFDAAAVRLADEKILSQRTAQQ